MPMSFEPIAGYVPWYAESLFKDKPKPDRPTYLRLLRSIEDGNAEQTRQFLANGLDPNALVGKPEGYLLDFACEKSRNIDCIRALLAAGAKTSSGRALSLAIGRHPDIVPELLAVGADPNTSDREIWHPVVIAAGSSQNEALKVLLAAGGNPQAASVYNITNNKAAQKVTALMFAAHAPNPEAVKLLLAAGANPNARDSLGNTPLAWARSSRSKSKAAKVIELLLKAGAADSPAALAEPPDFAKRAKAPEFQQAVGLVQQRLGTKPKPLELSEAPLKGSKVFDFKKSEKQKPLDILLELRPQLAPLNTLAFLTEYLVPMGQSRLVLLPTTDIYEAITALETPEGQSISHEDLIAWLKELHTTQPLDITTLSPDLLRARLLSDIKDPLALARQIKKICPDVAEGSLDQVATILQSSRELYLWWD